MAIHQPYFWGSLVAITLAGCGGEVGTSAPPAQPSHPPVASSSSALNVAGSSNAPAIAVDGAAGMVTAQHLAGAQNAPTSVAEDATPSTLTTPKFGILRGKVTTTPPQAAKHAVVYLANAPLDKVIDARIDDVKLDFHPHVSVMTAGGTMTYVNNHPFADSCFSTNNEKFDFGYVEAHGVRKRKFPTAGNYTLLCHVHPNEVAFLLVTPSSYFARADKKGEFVLPEVPLGSYEVVAWAPRVKTETKAVVITEGEVTLDFQLKR